jgi:cell division protein FtsZ
MAVSPTKQKTQFEVDLRPRISVIGVGGAGGNAVNNMIRAKLEGVDFFCANTDAQAIEGSLVLPEKRIQLGLHVTQGLGAGSKPDVGRAAAEESIESVIEYITGSNMVFITAGMGGGTGSGAAPVIARASRESGILTVGVVTKPFHFEGTHRMRTAERAIEELQQYVDTLIIIPNQNLFRIANERTTFADAFKMADDVLYSGVRGVTDLMIMPGLINLDFADIRSVMSEMGKAMMGTGEAEGDRRALDAAEAAISNPLLDDVSMKGARGVLINITGGYDMTLYEVDEAANRIRDDVESDANIIFGSTFDEKLNGRIRVSVVATGIGEAKQIAAVRAAQQPQPLFTHIEDTRSIPSINTKPQATVEPLFTPAPISEYQTPKFEEPSVPTTYQSSYTPEPASTLTSTTDQQYMRTEETFSYATHDQNQSFATTYANTDEAPVYNPALSTQYENGFSQSNHQSEYDQNQNAPLGVEKKKSTSLFERFTGVGRNKPQAEPQHKSSQTTNDKDSEYLDIPAFLRRGNHS